MTLSTVSTALLTNKVLASTTGGITLNGGTLQFTRASDSNIDAINSSAIGVNGGGTFSVTSSGGGASAIETIGAVTVNSGQMNFVQTANNTNQLTLVSLSRGAANNSAVTISVPTSFTTTKIVVTANGGVATTAGQILAPWATVGTGTGAQTDYAVFDASDILRGSGIANSLESTWSTTHALGSNYNVAITAGTATSLTATRKINTLRKTGGATQNVTSVAANVVTVTGSTYNNGDVVTVGNGANIGNLVRDTTYYVVNAGISGAGTFQLAASYGGPVLTLGASGGTLTGGLNLNGNNLETYGILNGSGSPLGIGTSGGVLTTPTGGGNLYLTAGSGTISINAPITDNGGAVTVVKGGTGGNVTLSGNNTFTGGLVVNAGGGASAVRLSGTQSFTGGITLNGGGLGENSANSTPFTPAASLNGNAITVNGPAHLLVEGTLASTSTITINSNAALKLGVGNAALTVTGVVSGSGVLDVNALNYNAGYSVSLTNAANTFSGDVIYTEGNGTRTLSVGSIGDSGKVTFGLGGSTQIFAQDGSTASGMTFNTRQFEMAGASGAGGAARISNNSPGQAFTINTDLLVTGAGTRTLTLQGGSAALSTFAGKLGSGSLTSLGIEKNGTGVWALTNTANSYTGATTLTQGTLRVSTLANGGSNSNIGASTNVAGNLILNGGTLQYTGGPVSTDRLFSLQGNGAIDASGSGAVNFNNTGSMGFNGGAAAKTLTFTGTNTGHNTLAAVIGNNTGLTGLTKSGVGTWVLGGSNTYTGITTVSGGKLVLDYGASNTSKLSDITSALVLGAAVTGGVFVPATLELKGGSHVEEVTSTTLTAGTGTSVIQTGGSSILRMNVITFGAGSTIDFAAANIASTSNANNASGILSNGATIGGTDWATNSGTAEGGAVTNNFITAYTGYVDYTRTDSGTQVIVDDGTKNIRVVDGGGSAANISLAAAVTNTNTINQSATGGAVTIDVASKTLRTNAILMGSTAGALTIGTSVGSGTLTTQAGGTSSITVTNHSSNLLTINSVIANNGTTSLVKNGTGVLVLTGESTYTGGTTLLDGTIRAGASTGNSNGILGSTNNNGIIIANKSTALFDVSGYYVAVKDLIGGGSLGGNVTLGSGTLFINNPANSANPYGGIISGTGGNLIVNGSSSWNTTSAHPYTGTTTIGAGSVTIITNNLQDGGIASGIGQSTSAASNLVFTGGTLRYTNSVTASTNRQFTVAGNAGLGVGGAGAITWSYTGAITYSGAGTRALFLSGDGTGLGTLAASIGNNGSDATSVTKSGTSNWNLTNTGSAFTGAITMSTTTGANGTLAYASAGGANAITFNQTTGSATLSYIGAAKEMSGLIQANALSTGTITLDASGAGAINYSNTGSLGVAGASGAKGLVLSGTNTGNNILAGQWVNNTLGGAATLTKNGVGAWTLTNSHGYSGATTINAGTLTITGATLSTTAITVGASGRIGLGILTPVTASSAAVTLSGSVQVAGTPTLASYTLLTASSITGTPVLATPIPGYTLVIDGGNTLKLNSLGAPVGFAAWQVANSTADGRDQDHDGDGVDNGTEHFLGGTANTTGFTAVPGVTSTLGTLSVTWTKAGTYTGTFGTDFVVETSTTLEGTWTTESSPGNVTFPTANEVKYTFPGGPAYSGKRFARLKVTGP